MTGSAWFKCFPSDFLNGVADLSPNELAVYTICLMRMYDEGGPISDDVERIARRCNMRPTACQKALDALCRDPNKLVRADGMLINPKAEKVIESRQKVSKKSADSARSRWKDHIKTDNENNKGAMRTHENPDANGVPYQNPDTRIQKEGSNEPSKALVPRAPDDFAVWYDEYPHKVGKPEALKAFRKAARKADLNTLLAGLRRYIATKPPDRPWCNPSTWLNQERWADQEAPLLAGGAKRNAQMGAFDEIQEMLNERPDENFH